MRYEPFTIRHQRLLLTAASSLLVLAACSSDDSTSAETPGTVAEAATDAPAAGGGAFVGAALVSLDNTLFEPTEIQIAVGESVSFRNSDGFDHTVTSKDDSAIEYDSGNLGEGQTFVQAYGEPGTFNFFCQIHPTMQGTITVN